MRGCGARPRIVPDYLGASASAQRVVVEVPRTLTGKQRELLEECQRVSSGEERGPLVGSFLESLTKLLGG